MCAMPAENAPLLLEQRLIKPDNSTLHCSETSLRLSDDRDHIVLSRYIEQYSLDGVQWVEHIHRVPVSTFLDWMDSRAELQTLTQGIDG